MSNNKIILECNNVHKEYNEGKLKSTVLKGVNLQIKEAEKIAILGSSGSGKSTLLHILGGLDSLSQGSVKLLNKDFSSLNANKRAKLRNLYLGFIYQFHHLLPEFTSFENIAFPLFIQKTNKNEIKNKVDTIIDLVGLNNRKNHKPSELSGGERQRVAIARSLINNPKLVLADEPTGNLDNKNAQNIYNLMQNLIKEYKTSFVIVTHDENFAQKMDRILYLQNGVLQDYIK